MLKRTITYTDFDGNSRTEDFYFNLSKAEVIEMEHSVDGGLSVMMKRIVEAKNTKQIIETFKVILLKAYGEKSADGRRFVKSEELSKAFSETEAYSDLFMKLATDAKAAIEFITAVVPPVPKTGSVTTIATADSYPKNTLPIPIDHGSVLQENVPET